MKSISSLVGSLLIIIFLIVGTAIADCGHGTPTGQVCLSCETNRVVIQPKKAGKVTQKAGAASAGIGLLDIVKLVLSKSTGLGLDRLF